jgi:hypothetical protein
MIVNNLEKCFFLNKILSFTRFVFVISHHFNVFSIELYEL